MSVTAFNLIRRRATERQEALQDEHGGTGTAGDAAGTDTGAGSAGDGANGAGDADGAGDGNTGDGDDAGAGGGDAIGDEASQGSQPDSAPVIKMDADEFTAAIKNKTNVMAELKRLGVEYTDRETADDLRDKLKAALAAKGMLPDGY